MSEWLRRMRRRGFVLPLAIVVAALMAMGTLSVYQMTASTQTHAARISAGATAWALADAALERALGRLQDDPSLAAAPTAETLNGNTLTYSIRQISASGSTRTVLIDARGEVRQSGTADPVQERILATAVVEGTPPAVTIRLERYERSPRP